MAVAQGNCPNCGAPIAFEVGASLAKVCEDCRHTVLRSDRGLENLGKVADLAHTPSLIAVGDEGTLGGRQFQVLGRVQLDHGAGPWDEYYVALDGGQSFAGGCWSAASIIDPVCREDAAPRRTARGGNWAGRIGNSAERVFLPPGMAAYGIPDTATGYPTVGFRCVYAERPR